MDKEIVAHEKEMLKVIIGGGDSSKIKDNINYNKRFIDYFQMERLHHLIVTLAVGLFAIVMLALAVIVNDPVYGAVSLVLLILFLFYILHYYKLENGVQRLYKIDTQLENLMKTSKSAN